jgi:hypothetical protein
MSRFRTFWRGHLYQAIEQLGTDKLLKANAYLCQDLYRWADDWSQESDSYCLFSLECLKMEDMIVRDGKIIAVIHPPLHSNEKMNEIFTKECVHLGLRAWAETDEASKKRYDYCSETFLFMQQIIPGDYNSYIRGKDYDGLQRRVTEASDVLISTLNASRNAPPSK